MKFTSSGSLQSIALAMASLLAGSVSPLAMAADSTDATKSINATMIENPLGDRSAVFERIAGQQTRIIFYRTSKQMQAGAATVYVNGYYHASLVPGGYVELCMPPNKAEIGVRMARVVGNRPNGNEKSITELDLNAGQTTFMRLQTATASSVAFQLVPTNEALAELKATRSQIHTLSRVPNAEQCIDGAAGPVSTPVLPPSVVKPQQINLAGDALFAFGKSDKNSLTLTGRQALDSLVSKIKAEFVTIERINVIGHADPLGDEVINDRLANERALSVREYLLGHGLQSTRITGQSKGSREPLVTTCSKEVSAASILCNQPNRRVVVEISGVPRTN